MDFPEEFLHYVWQFRSFDQLNLYSETGEELKIFHPGWLNKNAGPDFTGAKIKIGETTWAGNVEIHIKSSDWNKHNHQQDDAYNNVILHVVYYHDSEINRSDGTMLPVLVLKARVSPVLLDRFEKLYFNLKEFPCINQIACVDEITIKTFLSRTLIERLEVKTKAVTEVLAQLNGNWDETFYQLLARNFGFKVNALPFELLAKTVQQGIYAKHKDAALQIEALVFGAAGFLNEQFAEKYPNDLRTEFDFLRKKYRLKPLTVSSWKFLRMRPQNFPTLRLAQFAALILQSNHLFSKVLGISDLKQLRNLFENLPVNEFWQSHYHFKKESSTVNIQLGRASINNILLNTVVVFLFAYGRETSNPQYTDRALHLLELLPPEDNAIIKQYKSAGIFVENAAVSQGILQLKSEYCTVKKCLSCGIGVKLLKREES
ncbi:DUF2851 family protein [Pedobacter sp. AW1-32]|uniref:DUF2851 family protein n=1 Tax=Pedobacter sp. AW1-32 TaxID=3383026 RepID=UPI003FEFB96F